MNAGFKDRLCIMALAAMLALAAILFRPPMPIDETRYLTVAWEMFQGHNYFLPTLNFEPYHHKPPLMFWLINLSWEIFGAHRWAAVLALAGVSMGAIFLLAEFSRRMFPGRTAMNERLPWIMAASAPFLVFGTVIMFDFILALCVMLAWVFIARWMQGQKKVFIIMAGLSVGLGVLAKGPVVLLFTVLPLLFGPLWMPLKIREKIPPGKLYGAIGIMIVVGFLPVLVWLVPVYMGTSREFFEWLVLKQTTGRMTGNFGGAHPRPFYFYIPVFAALFVPWIFHPRLWKGLPLLKAWRQDDVLRFCFFAIVPALLIFMAMSGKQIHYLIPLGFFVAIVIARLLEDVPLRQVKIITCGVVLLMVAGQGIAAKPFFSRYDLRPVADIVAAHKDRDWAYVRNYHGEVGFLARLEKPVTGLESIEALPAWIASHPDGMAVVRYRDPLDVKPYKILYTQDFSAQKHVSVVTQMPENP